MKIKTKKKMSPEEYAKYMVDKHGISSLMSELIDDNIIDAPKRYSLTFELNPVPMKEISDTDFGNKEFTVEVEEELTGDTVIPKLMTTFKKTYVKDDFGYQQVRIDENYPIKLMLDRAEEHVEPIETLHMVNDDGTHTLIWRDGKMVG